LSAYITFAIISIVPVLTDAINPAEREDRRWFGAIFQYVHAFWINYIVTGFAIGALYFQAREIMGRPSPEALSVIGLIAQSIVFSVVTISWTLRVECPYENLWSVRPLAWYELVGWVVVDNAIFAIVQAVLLWVALRHARRTSVAANCETEPLLAS